MSNLIAATVVSVTASNFVHHRIRIGSHMFRSATVARQLGVTVVRNLSGKTTSLKEVLKAQIPAKQAALKQLKEKYGNLSLGEVTVEQCIGGGRDVKCMYYETSLLDAHEVCGLVSVLRI